MLLIDSHCHLDFPDFDQDRQAVIQQAQQHGIWRFIIAGTSRKFWPRLWQVVEQEASCYGALGLHPYFTQQHHSSDLQLLRQQLIQLAEQEKLCAIGEIGLDFQLHDFCAETQLAYFTAQLELACEFELPVIIHVRKAHAQVIACLKRYRPARGGIIHAFNGSREQAAEYHKLGFLLGIGGAYTWPQARKLRALLPLLPLEQLALETDSPDMSPFFAQGTRNSPANLAQICQSLAQELLNIPAEQLAWQTTNNLCQLFSWQMPVNSHLTSSQANS